MSTPVTSEERQRIINNNRSLRTIKNELESLIEHGAITDEVYDTIMSTLPAESPLNGSARSYGTKNYNKGNSTNSNSPMTVVPLKAMNDMRLENDKVVPAHEPVPTPTQAPAPAVSSVKTEIARACGLYRYSEPGDCNFEVGDQISVFEYMNPDWWLGKNLRTGQEGVFPQNYVQLLSHSAQGAYGNEKNITYPSGYPPPYQQQIVSPPSGAVNPYNSSAPPMKIAEQQNDSKVGKGGEMGKKFGKKLGNAAIFGAGATIGGNIVNSIF